jgi:demethoxyubiquinone hydroxylase (CLK1/Coq7/Cat5 family)
VQTILRTEIRRRDIALRPLAAKDKGRIRSALRTFHALETMAAAIYRFQITIRHRDLTEPLISAMANEMTHIQDFQIKLCEYGFRPSLRRTAAWTAGACIGITSRLLGRSMVLKTGIWVETKAIAHYGRLLSSVAWDPDTRRVVEKDLEDEKEHVSTWKALSC